MPASAGITVTFGGDSIGSLVDISQSGMVAGTVENTYQGSTATGGLIWRTHEPSGFVEPGDYTFKLLFDGSLPAIGTQDTLVVTWTSLAANQIWTWTGAIYNGFDPSGPMGAELVVNCKFKLSAIPAISSS